MKGWRVLGWLVAAACGKGETGALHTGTPTTPPTETESETASTDGQSPSVVSGTISCENTGGTSNVDTYFANLSATDPQGTDTIVSFGNTLTAFTVAGDQEMYTDVSLVCADDGSCSGSVAETVSGIPCASASDFYWVALLLDIEGHWSLPFTLTPI